MNQKTIAKYGRTLLISQSQKCLQGIVKQMPTVKLHNIITESNHHKLEPIRSHYQKVWPTERKKARYSASNSVCSICNKSALWRLRFIKTHT